MVNYPNGKKHTPKVGDTKRTINSKIEYGKRGMSFEDAIDQTNRYYLSTSRAVIHKKPTPVQVVSVDYPKRSKAVIKEAYFKTPSTTDYNGIFNGRHLDFEAKVTNNKTSFPFINIHEHQVEHMLQVNRQGGICFLLIHFSYWDEIYLLPFDVFHRFWLNYQDHDARKSIPLSVIKSEGYYIPYQYQPRLDYLSVIESMNESEEIN